MQAVIFGPTGLPLNVPSPAVVDPTGAALRATLKPEEYNFNGQLGGHYRIGIPMTGGLTGIGAGGIIGAFRWASSVTPSGLLCKLKRISVSAGTRTTAGSTAFALAFDATKVTGFTTQYNAGGAAITLGSSQKMRSTMANSQANIYYSNGSAVITGGTVTQDTQPFGIWQLDSQPVTTGVIRMGTPGDIYKDDLQGGHGVVFGPNEGFLLRFTNAQGTSAVTDAFFVIEWAEAMQF